MLLLLPYTEYLGRLGDPRNLEIVADFLSSEAVRIKEGADAVIQDWGGKPLKAKVRRAHDAGRVRQRRGGGVDCQVVM